jgi:hypothetical protein
MGVTREDLTGWTPFVVRPREGRPTVEWRYTAGIGFDDPFFEQTMERTVRNPFRLLFARESALEDLVGVTGTLDAIEPSGFVFHMSRCGSTLAAQMFAARRDTLVLSEAAPLDAVLGADPDVLRGMVAALGQRRTPEQRHLVVKLDAWAVFHLARIRAAFPDVPWVFLFRDPVPVLESQLRQRGSYLIPGMLPESFTGISAERAVAMPPEELCARVLATVCETALDAADPDALFVDHALLPRAAPDAIAPWFGIPCPPAERRRMLERARSDAKTPGLPFDSVRDGGDRGVDPRIRRAAEEHLAPVYARLRSVAERAA